MSETKVALITGASSGLGRAMASRFKQEGFKIVAVCRTRPEIEPDRWIGVDLTTAAGRDEVFRVMNEEFGGVDVLINNAGKGSYATWNEMPEEELRTIFELNFFSPVLLARQMLPLLQNRKGTIINIASVAARMPVPCMGAYCSSKAALLLYSDSLRPEISRGGVSVLSVLPGRIDTGFSSRAFGGRKPPETPGGGDAGKFADKVFSAYRRGRRTLVYPGWYRLVMMLPKVIPGLYDKKNIQLWGL